MRNTDEETDYWRLWTRLRPLAILVFLCFVGSSFADGAEKQLELHSLEYNISMNISSPEDIYVRNLNLGKKVEKFSVIGVSDEKINKSSYKVYLDTGKTKSFDFEVTNRIDERNQLLDCDILTCDFKIKIKSQKNLSLNHSIFSGGWQSGSASVQKIFFYENETYSYETPIYGIRTAYDQRSNKFYNESYVNSTKTVYSTRLIEQENLSKLKIGDKKDAEIIIRFSRPRVDIVDIYPVVLGKQYNDWAWWNASYNYRVNYTLTNPRNTTFDYQLPIKLYLNKTLTKGHDIRATWMNGTGPTEVQVDFCLHWAAWNWTNASGIIWVKVPEIAYGTNTSVVFIYYNSTTPTNGSDCAKTFPLGYEGFPRTNNATGSGTRTNTSYGVEMDAVGGGSAKFSPSFSMKRYIAISNVSGKTNTTAPEIGWGDASSGPYSLLNIGKKQIHNYASGHSWSPGEFDQAPNATFFVTEINYNSTKVTSRLNTWDWTSITTQISASSSYSYGTYTETGNVVTVAMYAIATPFVGEPPYYYGGTSSHVVTSLTCGDLSVPNTVYNVTTELYSNSNTCFNITADNVTLDCHGFKLDSDTTAGTSGVFTDSYNSTIKNCLIKEFAHGITVSGDGADFANITNNTIIGSTRFGIQVTGADNISITDNHISTVVNALLLSEGSNENEVLRNEMNISSFNGTMVKESSSNNISYNTINNIGYFSIDLIESNWNNVSYNNLYGNMSILYVLGSSDNYIGYNNATASIAEANTVTENTVYHHKASNNTIEFNRFISHSRYAMWLQNSDNNTMYRNLYISNQTSQIYGTLIITYTAVVTEMSKYNNFTSNIFNQTGNTTNGEHVFNIVTAKSNWFHNNTIMSSYANITSVVNMTKFSGNNTFWQNNITGSIWVNNTNETNIFNVSGIGNEYRLQNGTNVWQLANGSNLLTTNAPGWTDNGYGVNKTNFPDQWLGYSTDYNAWTNNSNTTPGHNANITMTSLVANTTDGLNLSNENIYCMGTAVSNDTGNLTFRGSWLRNGTNMTTLNWSILLTNNTYTNLSNLSYTNFGETDNISCTGYVDDGTNVSAQYWSNNVTVISTALNCSTKLSIANTVYNLTKNIHIDGYSCFNITAENITLDCHSFFITGNNAYPTFGVNTTKPYTTIKNCNIRNFSTGIYVDGDLADYANITNNTINTTHSTTCTESTGRCNSLHLRYSDNAVIDGNAIDSNTYAILVYNSALNNTITNNYVRTSSSRSIELYTGAQFNIIRYNIIKSSQNRPIYLVISDNNIIEYNNVSSNGSSIELYQSDTNNISWNNLTTTGTSSTTGAVYLTSGALTNNFTSNKINSTATDSGTAKPIYINSGSSNKFINNTIVALSSGLTPAIYLTASGTGNTFTQNNITAIEWVEDLGGTNYFNTSTEGNIYYFPNGTASWDVFNILNNGSSYWATSGSDLPFNDTTVNGNWSGYGEDWHPYTETESANPENATIVSFTNSTSAHVFNVTAYAEDADGGADITNWNWTISLGTCTNASNTTLGTRRSINLTCTSTTPGTGAIGITFKDTGSLTANTTVSSNAYPDHLPSLTPPTITGTPSAGNTLTCNPGVFSDIDGDTENTGARTWKWFNGTAVISGETSSTWLVPPGWAGSQVKCEETSTATTWTTSIAANNSTLTTIVSSNPENATIASFTNSTSAHVFNVTAYAEDPDGGADITAWNWTISLGTCVNASNTVSGNRRSINLTCTATTPGTGSIGITFKDSGSLMANTTVSSNAYPDHLPSLTPPTITGTPSAGNTLTCNPGVFSDIDSDTENTGARTWKWFNGTSVISGETSSTWLVPSGWASSQVKCEETSTATTWTTSIAANNSTLTTIASSNPENATIASFTNSTSAHQFNVTAYAEDADGASDITAWNWTISLGTCANASNTTSGTRRSINLTCTSTTPGTGSIGISFKDAGLLTANTTVSSNAYPDHLPSLTPPTITGTPNTGNTLTCNPGVFSDIDGDTENTGARTWKWFNGTAVISGETSNTWLVPSGWTGSQVKCEETSTATTWTTSIAANNSTLTTITSSNPENATITGFSNSTSAHSFNVTAYAEDADGASDITAWNWTISLGTCTNASNTTSGTRRSINLTCTSTTPGTGSIGITFKDSGGLSANTTISSNAYPDHLPSLTPPTITGTASSGNTLTCNPGVFSDVDGDTENTGARTWKWFNGTTAISGETSSTWLVPSGWSGSQVKCEETSTATTWTTSIAANNSTLTTIEGANPENATIVSFTNSSSSHQFNVTAYAEDADGASDITDWNWTISSGTCVNASNTTSGTRRSVNITCTGLSQITASIAFTFKDSGGLMTNTTESSNAYPDHNASLTAPTITGTATVGNTLTCNNGSFSDIDGDTENISSRTWKWYNDTVIIAGANSQTWLIPTGWSGTSVKCMENTTNSTWPTSNASNNSTLTLIGSTNPVNATIVSFTNSTTSHQFNVTAYAEDEDGASDITDWNWTISSGTCVNASNTTSGTRRSINLTCAGTSQVTASIGITFKDSSGLMTNTTVESNAYPDHNASLTQPTISGTAQSGNTLTCNNGSYSDIDGDTENISSRTWQWYNDTVAISGANAQTWLIPAGWGGTSVKCKQSTTNSTWTTSSASNNSSLTLIGSTDPVNATIVSFTNSTSAHQFNVTAYAEDVDGASDITNWNWTISLGTCVNASNTTSGTRRTINITCTSSNQGTGSIGITFKDSSNLMVNTTVSSNAYPDPLNASLSVPTITGTAKVGNTLTCNAGVWADGDGDLENASSRTWRWFNGTTVISGQTASTFAIPAGWKGTQVKCEETVYAQNWTTTSAANNSTYTTILNTAPTVPTADTLLPASPTIVNTLTGGCSGSTDADGDSLTYYYQFYDITDATARTLFTTTTTYALSPPGDAHDLFRVNCYANDGAESSTTRTGTTNVNISNTNPQTPANLLPDGGEYFNSSTISVNWTASTDADLDSITYYFYWSNDSGSSWHYNRSTGATSISWSVSGFPTLTTYRVIVGAGDGYGYSANISSASDFTINLTSSNGTPAVVGICNATDAAAINITITNNLPVARGETLKTDYLPLDPTKGSIGNGRVYYYNTSSSTCRPIPFAIHQIMSNQTNGSILISYLLPELPVGVSTVIYSYPSSGGSNGSNFDATFIETNNQPDTDNCTATASIYNTSYGLIANTTGGGNAICGNSTSLEQLYMSIIWAGGNYTSGRPQASCWGNPSAGASVCAVLNTSTSYLLSSTGTASSSKVTTPPIGQWFFVEIDRNMTMDRMRFTYLNGTASNWINDSGSSLSTGSSFSIGVDAGQQVGVTWFGRTNGYGGTAPSSVVGTVYDLALLNVNITSPANNTIFPPTTTAINFSWLAYGGNTSYSCDLKINGAANQTLATTNNTLTNVSVNFSVIGSYNATVYCANGTFNGNSSPIFFSIMAVNTAPSAYLSFTPNGTAYQLGPIEANITVSDLESTTLQLNYSFYKNGVLSETGSLTVANASTTKVTSVPPFTSGDVWDIEILVSDGSNSTANSSLNTSILNYTSNLSFNSTSPQYDILTYLHQLNLTMNSGDAATAMLEYAGSNHSAVDTGSGYNHVFNVNATPSQTADQTQQNFTWHYIVTLLNGSTFVQNASYNITVEPSGLVRCNGTYNVVSLNFSFVDFVTGAPVNTTYTSSYVSSGINRSISGADTTYTWCIQPTNESFFISTTETYASAGGYSTILTSRSVTANNTTQYFTIYMMNSSLAYPTTLSVYRLPNIPLSGVKITVSRYYPPSNYTILQSCTTNNAGSCLVYLIPNTIYYFYNLSVTTTTFGPEVLSCTPGSAICYRNFYIGTSAELPGTSTGLVSGSCSYSDSTGYITCNAGASITEVTGFALDLYQLGASTPTCHNTTTGSSATLTCAVPQINNTIWNYMLYSIETKSNELITTGQISINVSREASLGRDSWFIMLFMFVFLAAMGAAHPTLGIIFGILGLILVVFLGIVPLNAVTLIITGAAVAGGVIMWKLRT